jgi:hypothetical protein
MTKRVPSTNADQPVALFGLFLMLVVARLASLGYVAPQIRAGGLSGFLARRAIDGVAVIGWITDHLPQPATNGGM